MSKKLIQSKSLIKIKKKKCFVKKNNKCFRFSIVYQFNCRFFNFHLFIQQFYFNFFEFINFYNIIKNKQINIKIFKNTKQIYKLVFFYYYRNLSSNLFQKIKKF